MGCLRCGGDTEATKRFCPACWTKTPLKLRQRWWSETDYGKRQASDELVETMRGGRDESERAV